MNATSKTGAAADERPVRFRVAREQKLSWKEVFHSHRTDPLKNLPQTSRRYQFFWARNAIYHSLAALGISPGEDVLVPSYICRAAVEPIEAYGARPVFYAIQRDCMPDCSDLEAKISPSTRAVLAVHYFGFPCGIERIRDICDRHKLFLIEDCAHVLKGEADGRPLGSIGDASMFSWRKFFPLYDGADLVLNHSAREFSVKPRREPLLLTVRIAKNLIEDLLPIHSSPTPGTEDADGMSSTAASKSSAEAGRKASNLHALDRTSDSFDLEMANFPMTRLSRWLFSHFDLAGIVAARRNNFSYIRNELSAIDGVRPLFGDLPDGVCPWVFPFLFGEMTNGHTALRELGIPAVTWGGVRHNGITPQEFPAADFLYESLVFLPVHQDLSTSDLTLIVDAVRAVRERTRAVVGAVQFT